MLVETPFINFRYIRKNTDWYIVFLVSSGILVAQETAVESSISNETNALIVEQLNHQTIFCTSERPHWNTFGYFKIILVADLVDLGPKSLNHSNSSNTGKKMLLYPKMTSRLSQHLVRTKSKVENFGLFTLDLCYFLICILAAPWPTFGYYRENSLTSLMLVIAFRISVFGPREGIWVSTPNWVPNELWSQYHNPLSHSPQIAENALPRVAPSFCKIRKCPQHPNSYSLTLRWPLGLNNTSLRTNSVFKTSAFDGKLHQWVKVLGSTVSINWSKCPKYTKMCIVSVTVRL